MFFFEKKNQKTFVSFYMECAKIPRRQTRKSFFASFFSKKEALS